MWKINLYFPYLKFISHLVRNSWC